MTDSQWKGVLDYIDSHIQGNPTVAEIAALAGYSAFHFNRLFAAQMGIPVMEYVRMRKLQHAAAQVAQGMRILDIAVLYGFDSHEGFSRAFKRQYGITPQAFRALRSGPYLVPPQHTRHGILRGEIHMNPQKIHLDAQVLVGYRIETQPGSADIPAFWNAVMGSARWADLHSKSEAPTTNYGLCIHPAEMPEGRMDYMIALRYDGTSPLSPEMELFTLEAATYMAFPVAASGEDASQAIKKCWTEIYTQWLPTSGMAVDGYKPDFERYHGQGGVDIYIPIKA